MRCAIHRRKHNGRIRLGIVSTIDHDIIVQPVMNRIEVPCSTAFGPIPSTALSVIQRVFVRVNTDEQNLMSGEQRLQFLMPFGIIQNVFDNQVISRIRKCRETGVQTLENVASLG